MALLALRHMDFFLSSPFGLLSYLVCLSLRLLGFRFWTGNENSWSILSNFAHFLAGLHFQLELLQLLRLLILEHPGHDTAGSNQGCEDLDLDALEVRLLFKRLPVVFQSLLVVLQYFLQQAGNDFFCFKILVFLHYYMSHVEWNRSTISCRFTRNGSLRSTFFFLTNQTIKLTCSNTHSIFGSRG